MAKMKSNSPKDDVMVTLTMARPVAEAVAAACEWFLRQHMGQFWDMVEDLCMANYYDGAQKGLFKTEEQRRTAFDDAIDRRNSMQDGLDALYRRYVIPSPDTDRMKIPYRAEIAWLTIRYALSWHDKPEGIEGDVRFYDPINRSDQPYPKIELFKISKKGKK